MNQQSSTIAKNNASTNDTTFIATRRQSLGQTKTNEGSKTPGGGQRRTQRQQKTPPEEKLKRIENDIVKRSAMQDLMYRQRQLEDAVKEARRVNLMIEEEKQKMRELKSRMLENNLTQYVTITKQEIKQKDQKPIKKSFDQFDAHLADQRKLVKGVDDAEKDSDLDSLPGLIPPIDERRKKKKNDAPALPSSANMFDDNYAFYMYYLNNSGQLVTPVEQMFQDNAEKTEQIRKLQEDLEKKSRVVRPKINSTQSPDTQNKPGAKTPLRKDQSSKTNRLGTAKSVLVPQTPQSKGVLVNQSQPSPANKKPFLKRNPAPPAPGITSKSVVKINKQPKLSEIQDSSFERDTSVPQQQRSQSIQGISIKPLDQLQQIQQEESQSSAPPKKFTFLKRIVKNQSSPGTASLSRASPSRNVKTHLKSMSQDLVNPFVSQEIKQQTTEENLGQAQRLQSLELNSSIELHQMPNAQSPVNNSTGKSSTLKKKGIQAQSQLGLLKPSTVSQSKLKSRQTNDLSPSGSAAGGNRSKNNEMTLKEPQILIKKSSTRMNEHEDNFDKYESEQENLQHQSPQSNQGKRIPQSKLVKKGVSHSVKGSIDTSESVSTLHLPPLIKPSVLHQQISQTSTSQHLQKSNKLPQRPPLPTVKSSLSHHNGSALKVQTRTSSDTLMTLPSIPSSTTNKQSQQNTIPLNDYLLQNQSSTSLSIDQQQQQQQHNTRNDQSLVSSSRQSARSGGNVGGHNNISKYINNQHMNVAEERRAEGQAKRDKQNEYYKEVRASHKPKMDPRKQMEIEIRQNSVSLNQLELSARENPIKKVQLSDLLM